MAENENKLKSFTQREWKNMKKINVSMEGAVLRRCPVCGVEKPLNEFYLRPNKCKLCSKKEYNRKYRSEHREEKNARERKYRSLESEEKKEQKREYRRKYREDHREEIRDKGRIYVSKNREKVNANASRYRATHHEKVLDNLRKWHSDHREYDREYAKKYRIEHPEYRQEYRKKHPDLEYKRVRENNRRSLKKGNGGRITKQDWLDILERDGHKCLKCGGTDNLTLDHIVPLSRGGRNDKSNAQVLCVKCNSEKFTKTIDHRPLELFKQKELPL